jgi:nitric oxide reductase activation protein
MAEFIAKSRADAAAKNAAAPQTIAAKDQKPPGEQTPVGKSMEALKAVDSRSKEGIAEMFRLQRGASDDLQERIARAAERTADAVEEGEEQNVYEMAGN